MATKSFVQSSESTLGGNVCGRPGKLGPGASWVVLLGTLKSNRGEEILEDSTYSGLVTHESFTAGKIYVITYNNDVIHL